MRVGPYWDTVQATSAADREAIATYGVTDETYQQKSLSRTALTQYFFIVRTGLRNADHLFRGLKRPLWYDGDAYADRSVLIYAWRPLNDYEWVATASGIGWQRRTPPPDRVFVVLVREIRLDEHGVGGVIDQWNWVEEDQRLRGAPKDWHTRYAEKVWGKP
jgi:hypothetical protein